MIDELTSTRISFEATFFLKAWHDCFGIFAMPLPKWCACIPRMSKTMHAFPQYNTTTVVVEYRLSSPCHTVPCHLYCVSLKLHFNSIQWCHFMSYMCPSFHCCPFCACLIYRWSLLQVVALLSSLHLCFNFSALWKITYNPTKTITQYLSCWNLNKPETIQYYSY